MYMYINKLSSRSYGYIHLKSSHICVIHLVLERCCFEAVLPQKRLCPLGVKGQGPIFYSFSEFGHAILITILMLNF